MLLQVEGAKQQSSAAAKEKEKEKLEPVVVSEYELERQRNIERNQQRLQALGVHTSLQAMAEPLTKSAANSKPKKVRHVCFCSTSLRACGRAVYILQPSSLSSSSHQRVVQLAPTSRGRVCSVPAL